VAYKRKKKKKRVHRMTKNDWPPREGGTTAPTARMHSSGHKLKNGTTHHVQEGVADRHAYMVKRKAPRSKIGGYLAEEARSRAKEDQVPWAQIRGGPQQEGAMNRRKKRKMGKKRPWSPQP